MLALLLFILLIVAIVFLYQAHENKRLLEKNYKEIEGRLEVSINQTNFLQSNLKQLVENEVVQFKHDLERRHQSKYDALLNSIPKKVEAATADAVKRQRSILKGQISEQLSIFLPNFPYESSDCIFIGKPFDILVVDGLSKGEVQQIVLMDIKTGKSQLTFAQKQIKDCIEAGKMKFQKLTINDDFSIN